MTDDYVGLLVLATVALIGVWAVVEPAGIIGWAKHAHPSLNEDDPSVRSVARFVGVSFVALSVLVFAVFVYVRYR